MQLKQIKTIEIEIKDIREASRQIKAGIYYTGDLKKIIKARKLLGRRM